MSACIHIDGADLHGFERALLANVFLGTVSGENLPGNGSGEEMIFEVVCAELESAIQVEGTETLDPIVNDTDLNGVL